MEADNLNIAAIKFSIGFSILGYCTGGEIKIVIDSNEYIFSKGDLIVIQQGYIISLKEKSDDFRANYFVISESFINEILSGISRISPLFYIHMRKKIFYKLDENEIYRYLTYFELIANREKAANNYFQKEYIVSTLRLFYLDLYNNYKNNLQLDGNLSANTRKEQVTYDFFLLILEHHMENREVAFYAKKMSLTPKYLSSIIKETSGRSAKDWIVQYTLFEIKSLLMTSKYNIQEIAVRTNFSNQASFGRFFKKYTGISPSNYKNKHME
ncbi:AraC family transcriptional regulator [Dysgonomonas sp. 511]|uniref:helix-turn-helix domain-containing protein n=1 Tax=Dysgonomonas sp. 511 TaxID=2302930 RepID=UPI0013D76C69|nr:helix-turn-helix domain-containing protein [Dysgonomonas sp. 511]